MSKTMLDGVDEGDREAASRIPDGWKRRLLHFGTGNLWDALKCWLSSHSLVVSIHHQFDLNPHCHWLAKLKTLYSMFQNNNKRFKNQLERREPTNSDSVKQWFLPRNEAVSPNLLILDNYNISVYLSLKFCQLVLWAIGLWHIKLCIWCSHSQLVFC